MKFSRRIKNAIKAFLGRPIWGAQSLGYEIKHNMGYLAQWDFKQQDLISSRELLVRAPQLSFPARVNWLLVNFTHPFGGVFTVLRIADYLQRRGFDSRLLVYDNPRFSVEPVYEMLSGFFPALSRNQFGPLLGAPPASDFAFATFFPSCYHLLADTRAKRKLYIVQDFESVFYPAGSLYALSENTYRLPFHRLYNTPGLRDYIEANYPVSGTRAHAFTPAVDARYFCAPERKLQKPYRVLIYGRPGTNRNAFELALMFAAALKAKYMDSVEIVCAGENFDLKQLGLGAFAGIMQNAGVVPYTALPGFYASFHFVLAMMLSKHPSYPPFEAMASGNLVIANANEANTWFLKDGENCVVSMPTVNSLLDAFERATEPSFYAAVTERAVSSVRALSWERELCGIEGFLRSL